MAMDVPGYTRRDIDCSQCVTEEMKRLRGCTDDAPPGTWPTFKLEDGRVMEVTRCPLATVTSRHRRIVQYQSVAEAWYALPEAGGFVDQANCVIRAMCIVAAVKADIEDQRRAK